MECDPQMRHGAERRSAINAYLVVLCVLLGSVAGATGRAQQARAAAPQQMTSREQAAVAQVERQWVEALNNGDVRTLASILADDFERPAADQGAFIDKTELLSWYGAHWKSGRGARRRIQQMSVSVYGTAAVARGRVATIANSGQVTATLLFTDVFVLRGGRWQAVSAQENRVPNTGTNTGKGGPV